ncbi:predicted protein [Nematostella vectensis]|uniref:RING-type domain-containing protein n=1 Tax=Nematostella vectensis TaxID=45351 RepID=A7SFB3_NEMVE|nr:uncharacterized protein LOC5509118 [Nematostella vectensis]EDO37593.1 predicted protein [Nematostella vectensis]|eukprot:XP_001629656.1 predicted protein [Nematostella vectensis]
MPPSVMSSPKFITCPDCGERYDKTRKRRVIDTCGHPRCFSCLFQDEPCVLCEKLPVGPGRQRATTVQDRQVEYMTSDELLKPIWKLSLAQSGLGGSQPDIRALAKDRSATMPSFREDSYFRSLYRYEPSGSQEQLSINANVSSSPRPKSLPPSYNKSLDNLHEQFWRSVQHVQRSNTKEHEQTEDDPKSGYPAPDDHTPEVVECPAPNVVKLPVPPRSNRHKSSTDLSTILHQEREKIKRELQLEALKKQAIMQGRTRSHSELVPQEDHQNRTRPGLNHRPQSWSPRCDKKSTEGSPIDNRDLSNSRRLMSGVPITGRTTPMSDESSEASVSLTESVSSCSYESGSHLSASPGREEMGEISVKSKVSPLANVTYWVTTGKRASPQVTRTYLETDLDAVIAGQRWTNTANTS